MRIEQDRIVNYLASFGAPDSYHHHVSSFQILHSDGTHMLLDHPRKKLTLSLMEGTSIQIDCPSDGSARQLLSQSVANAILCLFLPAVLHGTARISDGEPIPVRRKPE